MSSALASPVSVRACLDDNLSSKRGMCISVLCAFLGSTILGAFIEEVGERIGALLFSRLSLVLSTLFLV